MTDPLFATEVVGHGPVKIIAVHGWMGDHRLFDPIHDLIDRDAWTVAFPDCRGYGTRRDILGKFTVEEIADDILGLARHLGWTRFHVLGHSMAGMAAQRLMIDTPACLESVILLAAVPATGARIDDARRALLKAGLANPEARLALIDINTGKVQPAEWLRGLCNLSLLGTRPDVMEAFMASWAGPGFADELRGSPGLVSVLIGSLDPGTPLQRTQEIYADLLPNARVVMLSQTGHYAMQENPASLVALIEEHLVLRKNGASEVARL